MSDFTKMPLSDSETSVTAGGEQAARQLARVRLEKKRRMVGDIVAYIVINAFLVGIWAVSGFGYFWPGWVMAGWGVFLALAVWDVYFRAPIREADVTAEMRRMR